MTRHARLRTKEELGLPKWMPAVEGSFDDPPIVLRQDRLKHGLICAACAALGIVPTLLFSPPHYTAWHLLWLVLAGLAAVAAGCQALFPGALILDPAGIVLRSVFSRFELQWQDIDRFRLQAMRGGKTVVGNCSATYRASLGWRRVFYGSVDLGGHWELPPQRVVDVLNEARARWGSRT